LFGKSIANILSLPSGHGIERAFVSLHASPPIESWAESYHTIRYGGDPLSYVL
jgi:hypothetical protein